MRNPLERYLVTTLRHPRAVVALAVAVMSAAAVGVRFMEVTNSYLVFFRDDSPRLLAFRALENTYSSTDRALIAVAPGDGSVFTREALAAVLELTDAAWEAPYARRVDSLTNYSHSEAVGEDDLVVGPLVEDAASLGDDDLARIEAIAMEANDLVGRLVAPDGGVTGVVVTFLLPEDQDQGVIEINEYLDAVLEEARARHPDIEYRATGDVRMHRAFAEATVGDLATLTPVVLVVIVVLTTVFLRSAWGTVAILAVLAFSVNTTLGLAGWSGVVFSPTNSGVPIIVMVVAVADAIHIVTSVLLGMKRGRDKESAILEAFRINRYPIFLTSVTTAAGFLGLNAAESPQFHDLGNYVALGVLCAFVYTMTFLPALLVLLPLRAPRPHAEGNTAFDRLATLVIERRRTVLLATTACALFFASGISRIELNDNPIRYFDDRYEFRQDSDYVAENLTSLDRLEYSLDAGGDGAITEPGYLRTADAFAAWFREQPEVTHVQAFPDVMKRLNRNMHGDDPAFHRLPEDRELAAQYLLLYELSLPFGSDLNDRIDIAKSATRMVVATDGSWSRELLELDERAQRWVQGNAPGLAGEATGISILFAHVSRTSIDSMLAGTALVMAVISLLLLVVFRSPRVGLLSLVPNFIPAVMSFGLWGHLVGRVGIASSVMVAIAFGIIVDDTIHFLGRYLRGRREGLAPADAVRATFSTVGHALLTTTVVFAAGFLVFAFSGFEVSWSLGLLVATTILLALGADFLLLPALLLTIDRENP